MQALRGLKSVCHDFIANMKFMCILKNFYGLSLCFGYAYNVCFLNHDGICVYLNTKLYQFYCTIYFVTKRHALYSNFAYFP